MKTKSTKEKIYINEKRSKQQIVQGHIPYILFVVDKRHNRKKNLTHTFIHSTKERKKNKIMYQIPRLSRYSYIFFFFRLFHPITDELTTCFVGNAVFSLQFTDYDYRCVSRPNIMCEYVCVCRCASRYNFCGTFLLSVRSQSIGMCRTKLRNEEKKTKKNLNKRTDQGEENKSLRIFSHFFFCVLVPTSKI